jgi:peptide methionine sulfoxide reductase msrA/msrB
MNEEIRTIYLAGGCFWGIEHLMKALPGVVDTACGYANGTGAADANYEKVCTGTTNFRETVRVRYDATKTSVDALLYALFQVIEPDAVNRQGADVGTQYQAGIYWLPNDREAEEAVTRVCGIERARTPGFAVEVKPLENYFEAEEYHQDYLDKNPDGYCHVPFAKIRELSELAYDDSYYRL